jgi:hypothetical protein
VRWLEGLGKWPLGTRGAMKRALLAALLLVGLVPAASAGAEDPTPDMYSTTFGNIIGIIAAGGADWYVSYPTNVPTTGTYHVAVTASTTAAATATLGITAGTFQGSGCTVGAFVSDTSATSQASGYFPVTVTGPYCFGSIRLTITATSTVITAIRASFQIAADTVTVSGGLTVTDDGNGWLLTGIPDTQEELQAIADALAAGLTVKLCGQSGACGIIETSANTTINVGSTNVTEAQQVAVTFPGNVNSPGLVFVILLPFLFGLLIFFWWHGMRFAAAWAAAALLVALIPGLAYGLLLPLILIVIGVLIQFFREEEEDAKDARPGDHERP